MSINLTQEFTFETDSIETLEEILRVAVKCFFSNSGFATSLHLKAEKPSSFDDGTEFASYWNKQKCVLPDPVDKSPKRWYVIDADRTFHGATFYKAESSFVTPEEAAQAVIEKHKSIKKPKPTRLWAATVADYKGGKKKADKAFSSYLPLVSELIQTMRSPNRELFRSLCGSGYNSGFNSDDGSIDIGYRVQHRPNGGWNELDLSWTHIYYGK